MRLRGEGGLISRRVRAVSVLLYSPVPRSTAPHSVGIPVFAAVCVDPLVGYRVH